MDIVVDFVTRLENLKLLYFEYEGTSALGIHVELSENDASKIFERCPSLRIFVCREIYFRDVLTKRVRKYVRSSGTSREVFLSMRRELLQKYLNTNEEFEMQYGWVKLL